MSLGGGSLYPLVYLLMAFLVAFLPRLAGVLLLAEALVFDGVSELWGPHIHTADFAAHAAFLALFAALYHLVLAAQLLAARTAGATAVKRRLAEVEERARAYRLVTAAGSEATPEQNEQWLVASVREVEGAVGTALEVVELALSTYSCSVFLLSLDERELKLHDCRAHSDTVRREAFRAGEGVLAGVIKRALPLRLAGSIKGVVHHEGGPPIGSLLAVPLCEASTDGGGPRVAGILVADRLEPQPFTEKDERLLAAVATEVLRSIEVERVMGYIKKARDEKDGFYRAIEDLNQKSKPAEVLGSALDLARNLGKLDFAALTLVEGEGKTRKHRVCKVAGVSSGRALENYVFADNTGLVANVVRYGAPLPGRDLKSMDHTLIFDEEAAVKGLASLKIIPLRAGDRILGTLVAGCRRRGMLEGDAVAGPRDPRHPGGPIHPPGSALRADGAHGHHGWPHRAHEPPDLPEPNRGATGPGREVRPQALHDPHRHRPLQERQRHLRPPRGDQVLRGVSRILAETGATPTLWQGTEARSSR